MKGEAANLARSIAKPYLPQGKMLNTLFLESKAVLYCYVDAIEQDDWPEHLYKHAKALIRKWLYEKSAPPDEVAALTREMGMSDEMSANFTADLCNSIELLQSEPQEDGQAEHPAEESKAVRSFSLTDEMRFREQPEKQDITQQVLACQDRLKAEKELAEHGSTIDNAERWRLQSIVDKGKRAEESVIASCWNIIMYHVKSCSGNNVPDDDLIQESILGVIRATERYDPEKSAFGTYATYWIKKAIKNAIAAQARSIPMPENTTNLVKKIRRVAAEHESRTGTLPGEQEISQLTGYSVKRIHNATHNERQSRSISMEALVACDSDSLRLVDSIRDPNAETQFDHVLEQTQEVNVRKLLSSSLPPMDEIVLLLTFGFEDGQAKPMSDIGVVLGYTKENIRQIKLRAARKLGDQKCLEKLATAS